MSFWKLVGAIVVGNLLTAVVLWLLSMLFLASLLASAFGHEQQPAATAFSTSGDYPDAYQACVNRAKDKAEADRCSDVNEQANSALKAADEALANAANATQGAQQ